MKSKKKLKTTIISLSIFLVVVLGVGAVGFYVAGDYIFTKLLESYVEDEMMNSLVGVDVADEEIVSPETETVPSADATGTTKQVEAPKKAGVSSETEDKATQTNNKPKAMTKEEIKKVVKEKAKAINEAIPTKDKAEISSLILGNLSQEDISYLVGLVADGISEQDIAEAKSLARSRFSEEQMAEVYAYYKQYSGAVLK